MTPAQPGAGAAQDAPRPIVWSIAGNDSGGGAGLAADLRAAQAWGVHLCPVVAALTAQNSCAVTHVQPVAPALLEAQLAALADDMPPAAVKTGLLGGADNIAVVARWVDRLRARHPRLALVVDPVLGATTGAAFADEAALRAYRELLLPRATVVAPNEAEARRLLGAPQTLAPTLAQQLRALGAGAVAITGGDSTAQPDLALDWIDTAHACGWLALPRQDVRHTHGTGCCFATSAASALALGFVPADALVLAKMATARALRAGYAAGQGAGPVAPRSDFGLRPELLPSLSWGDEETDGVDTPSRSTSARVPADTVGAGGRGRSHPSDRRTQPASPEADIGLYAIVDSAERVRQVVAAGVRVVQLRIKTPDATLREVMAQALAACQAAGATLVVNDHWRLAAELGAPAVHLGQEDLLALGAAGRAELAASGLALGISSHSLWELARTRTLAPWYVACGPVWPTLTKAMPWVPQGMDNLAWWVHMAGVPVVAIGGILAPAQLRQAAQSGASGVCVVRGLGDEPARSVPVWQAALQAGRGSPRLPLPVLPHPSLRVTA